MYQVQSQGRPPRKRPSFGEAFRESFGGALGNALVNIPSQIGGGAASDAIGKRLGLHYGEGGKGWRGNMPEGEVSQYDALQALVVPKAELGMDLTRAQTEESRARSPLYGARTEGALQDIGHKELMFPNVLGQAQTATDRASHLQQLLTGDDPAVRIDQNVATYRDPATGSRRAAGIIAPKTVPGKRAKPSAKKMFDDIQKMSKDLREPGVVKTTAKDGTVTTKVLTPAALATKNRLTMAKIRAAAIAMQQEYPVLAVKYINLLSDNGKLFTVDDEMTLEAAIVASQGAVRGARASKAGDVSGYSTDPAPAVASEAVPVDRTARPIMQAGQMRSQAVSAVKRISEARKAINGIAAASYLTDTMKANMTAQAQAEMAAATTDATNLNTSLTEMGVAPVAIPAAVK